jgi:integrase
MALAFGDDRDPATITWVDVQTWVSKAGLKPASLRRYLVTLRGILDHAGVKPNPAADARVRLPRLERVIIEPPSAADVETLIEATPTRWRLALRTLAETGMRVGELQMLEWRDVDQAGSRFRIREGKTAAARRWAAVPPVLVAMISAQTPPDDRTPERRVFQGATTAAIRSAMARACKSAGIADYSPHDLRHRYASV